MVAATNAAGELWSQSHWGANTVDIGAPGGGILSTVPFANARYMPAIASASAWHARHADALRSCSRTGGARPPSGYRVPDGHRLVQFFPKCCAF